MNAFLANWPALLQLALTIALIVTGIMCVRHIRRKEPHQNWFYAFAILVAAWAGFAFLPFVAGCGSPQYSVAEYRAEFVKSTQQFAEAFKNHIRRTELDDGNDVRRLVVRGESWLKLTKDLEPVIDQIRELRPPSQYVSHRNRFLSYVLETKRLYKLGGEGLRSGAYDRIFESNRNIESHIGKMDALLVELLKEVGSDKSVLGYLPVHN